jgi:hypothetical protein
VEKTTKDCFDCGNQKGVFPVVLTIDKEIKKVCKKCFYRDWQEALHPQPCPCDHCKSQEDLIS